jgi:hypothetical protein
VARSASRVRLSLFAGAVTLLALSRSVEAQDARPPTAVETWAGYGKGWGEDQDGHHAQAGAGLRFYVSPRVSLNPRVRYARRFDTPDDSDQHRELALEAALMVEFRRPANGRPRFVSPFLFVSGGVSARRYQASRYSSERTVTDAGLMGIMVGARLFLPFARGRMYVAPAVGYANLATMAAAVTFGMPLSSTAP